MNDPAYLIPTLPVSMEFLTFDGANSIERNLAFIGKLFSAFDATVSAPSLGSLGYLEAGERGITGSGFLIEYANKINHLAVAISGEDLTALRWEGENWQASSVSSTQIVLSCSVAENSGVAGVQNALSTLLLYAADELDAEMYLTAGHLPKVLFDSVGPVKVNVRSGATWALVEHIELTWQAIQTAEMTWTDLESLHK